LLPIPATLVIGRDGRVKARFIDPDFRHRMGIETILRPLPKRTRARGPPDPKIRYRPGAVFDARRVHIVADGAPQIATLTGDHRILES
jgi:hypothetical protein